jgi:hypothetical protein
MVPEANSRPHLHRALENGRSPRELLNDFDKLSHVVVPQKQLWIKTEETPEAESKDESRFIFNPSLHKTQQIQKERKKHPKSSYYKSAQKWHTQKLEK